jgi:CheY-like chemotaxis protein
VALVGRYAHRPLDVDGLIPERDVVFVESTAHAYSKIKRALPDVIVMCVSADDVDGCQVLSMLALDRETSHIPVLTYMTSDPTDCVVSDGSAHFPVSARRWLFTDRSVSAVIGAANA